MFIYFVYKYFGFDVELIFFFLGIGYMIMVIWVGEIDVVIGLMEGWIVGLGKIE